MEKSKGLKKVCVKTKEQSIATLREQIPAANKLA